MTYNCTSWHKSLVGENCTWITTQYGITANDFLQWNPTVGLQCQNYTQGCDYCVGNSTNSTTSPIYYPSSSTWASTNTWTATNTWASTNTWNNGYTAPASSYNTWGAGAGAGAGGGYSTLNGNGYGQGTTYQSAPWLKPTQATPECVACEQPSGGGSVSNVQAPGGVSTDGRCGQAHMGAYAWTSCANSAFGYCCSSSGYCGNSTESCTVPYCDPLAGYCYGYGSGAGRSVGSAWKRTLGVVGLVGMLAGRLLS